MRFILSFLVLASVASASRLRTVACRDPRDRNRRGRLSRTALATVTSTCDADPCLCSIDDASRRTYEESPAVAITCLLAISQDGLGPRN